MPKLTKETPPTEPALKTGKKSSPKAGAAKKPSLDGASKPRRSNTPPTKVKNADARPREYLTPAEIKQLKIAANNSGRHGFRDWLVITIMYRHALRVGELCDLQWEQIDLKKGRMHVNRMKNGDPSMHYLEEDEIRSLRQLQKDYASPEYVFISQRQDRLTNRTVHNIIAKCGELAGIKFPIHPHMLRHSKGYQLAARGEDTRSIQAYLGHKNIQHTAMYTKVDPRKLKGFGRD